MLNKRASVLLELLGEDFRWMVFQPKCSASHNLEELRYRIDYGRKAHSIFGIIFGRCELATWHAGVC